MSDLRFRGHDPIFVSTKPAAAHGGPATGKTHVATALGIQAIKHHRRKVRFFSTIELVNPLEQEKAKGKAGQIAEGLTKLDLLPQGIYPPDQFLIFVHPG